MAKATSQGAPSSFAEGAGMIVSAISATMMAPDAQQHLPMLDALLKTVVGQVQKHGAQPGQPGQGGPPGGAPPGGPPGGGGPPSGTNIQSLMGQGSQGGPAGPGGGPSSSGIGSDDLRRTMASTASEAG